MYRCMCVPCTYLSSGKKKNYDRKKPKEAHEWQLSAWCPLDLDLLIFNRKQSWIGWRKGLKRRNKKINTKMFHIKRVNFFFMGSFEVGVLGAKVFH